MSHEFLLFRSRSRPCDKRHKSFALLHHSMLSICRMNEENAFGPKLKRGLRLCVKSFKEDLSLFTKNSNPLPPQISKKLKNGSIPMSREMEMEIPLILPLPLRTTEESGPPTLSLSIYREENKEENKKERGKGKDREKDKQQKLANFAWIFFIKIVKANIAINFPTTFFEKNIKGNENNEENKNKQNKKQIEYKKIGIWLTEELQNLGPVYVKIGQLVATQSDVPYEIAKELERLQDKSTMLPFDQVSEYVRFPKNVVHVENEPIAGASLGIVYKGIWIEDNKEDNENENEKEVAIKVLRPNIKHELSANLWSFARFLRRLAHLSNGIEHLLDVVRQYRVSFWKELDYVREAQNSDRLAASLLGELSDWNVVPEVFHATDSYIIMAYVPGLRITNVQAILSQSPTICLSTVADYVLEAFLYQVLVSDIFHSDPHPGNIALQLPPLLKGTDKGTQVIKEPKLIWYDTGSIMECTGAWRSDLVRLSLAILKSDVNDIVITLQDMKIVNKDKASSRAVQRFIRMLLSENEMSAISNMSSKQVMASITEIMDRDPLWRSALRQSFVSNSQYVILGKSVVTINANCVALDPTFSLIPRATPIINKYLNQNPNKNSRNQSQTDVALREIMDLAKNMLTMPGRINILEKQLIEIGEDNSERHKVVSQSTDLINKVLLFQLFIYFSSLLF